MKKVYIALAILALLPLLLLLLWLGFRGSDNQANNGSNQTNNLPTYRLLPNQEEHIKLLAKIYAEGYNTYSKNDYRELWDVKGNATPELANQIQKFIDELQSEPRWNNYQVVTTIDINSFTYQHPDARTIQVRMEGVTEQTKAERTVTYPVIVAMKLVLDGELWLLDEITTTKK
jgi:hypothetical protein